MEQNNFTIFNISKRYSYIALIISLIFFTLLINPVMAQEATAEKNHAATQEAPKKTINAGDDNNNVSDLTPKLDKKIIKTKGLVYENFARLIFYTKENTKFDANIQEDNLLLSFNNPINLSFADILTSLNSHILSAGTNDDKKNIYLKLKYKNTKIRKFIGDDFVGIDLIQASPNVKPSNIETQINITSVNNNPAQNNTPNPNNNIKKTTTDNISKSKAAPSKKSTIIKKKAPQAISDIIDIERKRTKHGIKLLFKWNEESAATIFKRSNHIWAIFDRPKTLKTDKIKGIQYINNVRQIAHRHYTIFKIELNRDYIGEQKNRILISAHKDDFTWELEIIEQTNEPKKEFSPEDLPTNAELINTNIPNLEKKSEEEFTSTPKGANIINYEPKNPISILASKEKDSEKTHLILKTGKSSEPLTMIDSEIGDTIIIIPLYKGENALHPQISTIDFTLLQTAQGIALLKKSDNLKYKVTNNKIKIFSDNGLNISYDLYENEDEKDSPPKNLEDRSKIDVLPEESVFPFKNEQDSSSEDDNSENGDESETDIPFTDKKNQLYLKLTTTTEEQKTEARLEIAKFFYSRQLFPEATGVLEEIKKLDPLYNNMQLIDLMLASSMYMQGRFLEAYNEFTKLTKEVIELDSYNEIAFWKWASFYKLNKLYKRKEVVEMPIDYITIYDKFMKEYPDELRYDLGLISVDYDVEKNNIKTAKTILEIISGYNIPEKYKNHTKFFWAKFNDIEGLFTEAEEIYEEIIADVDDRYNRARAKFELTKMRLIHGKIDINEAVAVFDQLGIVWRGDRFEMDLLKLMGQLYLKKEDYYNALKSWRILVANFPNTREAVILAGKMKKTFIELFDKGIAYKIPPFEALSLYFEFKELTPVGARGDRIIQQLSEHFVNADLLENASALILHQVKYRTTGEQKYKLALRLADLHLQNNMPELAIEALAYIDLNKASDKTKLNYVYMDARIEVILSNFDKAQEILKGDFSEKANNIRLDMFWKKKNWFGIINIVENKYKNLLETAPFSLKKNEAKNVIHLAVAYGTQEKREKLRQIRKDFASRINDKSLLDVFNFVTHDIKDINHEEFQETVQLDEIEKFMNDYAFWPGKDWHNVVSVLEPKMDKLIKKPELSQEDKNDIVKIGIAYSHLIENPIMEKALNSLNRDFRRVTVDRTTIKTLEILDNRFEKMNNDAVFEGKIPLVEIPQFIEKYIAARSISELNAAIK